MEVIPAGLFLGTTMTSLFRVKFTGLDNFPAAKSCAGWVVAAARNTSAGAPLVICVASVPELPNEYVGPLSIAGSTSVSDAAAKTVRPVMLDLLVLAAAPPVPSDVTSASTSARPASDLRTVRRERTRTS